MSLVSHVMPVWRPRPEWLLEAVASALDERVELELIVVDDGCDPPVQSLGLPADPRLRIIRIEHAGVAGARNAGVAAARGEYLRYLDADDVVAPGSTGRLLALADGRDDLIAYGATAVCDEELHPSTLLVSDVEGDAEAACLLGAFDVRVVSLLFPRRVVELTGPWEPELPISVDWDYVLRALAHARVAGSRIVATYYRRHGGSLTRTADVAAGERARALIIDRWLARRPEQAGTPLERRARTALLVDRGLAYAGVGETGTALQRLGRAALRDPGAAAGPLAWALKRHLADTLSRRTA